jgi:tellurite resistance protein
MVGEAMERDYVIADIEGTWDAQARAAIREVAAWLDQQCQHGCSLLLREEADR